jgi:hypothetical protein
MMKNNRLLNFNLFYERLFDALLLLLTFESQKMFTFFYVLEGKSKRLSMYYKKFVGATEINIGVGISYNLMGKNLYLLTKENKNYKKISKLLCFKV